MTGDDALRVAICFSGRKSTKFLQHFRSMANGAKNRMKRGDLHDAPTRALAASIAKASGSLQEKIGDFGQTESRQIKTADIILHVSRCIIWLRGLDLNQRPLGYEPNELPSCSTPRQNVSVLFVCIISTYKMDRFCQDFSCIFSKKL